MFVILLLFFFHFFYFFIYLFISAVEYTVQCNPCWICVVELCSVATRVEVLSIFCTMLLELYQIRKLHVFQHKNCFCCHFCLLYENEAVKPPQICRSLSFVAVSRACFFPFSLDLITNASYYDMEVQLHHIMPNHIITKRLWRKVNSHKSKAFYFLSSFFSWYYYLQWH